MAYVDARPDDGPADGPVALLLHGGAVVVLPLPARDRGAGRRAGSGASHPTWSASAVPTSRLRPATDTYARHVECGARARLRPPRPARRHAGRAGLGRPDRTAAGRRAPGPVRARRGGQHRAADRGLRHAGDLVACSTTPSAKAEVLDIGRLVAAGCVRGMTDDVRAAYDAPFPEERAKAGARADADRWSRPVPTTRRPRPNRAAWAALGEWQKPFLVAVRRLRPDHRRDGARSCAATSPARDDVAPPDPGRRRPLPPGGRRHRARPRDRRLRGCRAADSRRRSDVGPARGLSRTSATIARQAHSPIAVVAAASTGAVTCAAALGARGEHRRSTWTGSAARSAYRFWIGSSVGHDRVGHGALQRAVRRRRPSAEPPQASRTSSRLVTPGLSGERRTASGAGVGVGDRARDLPAYDVGRVEQVDRAGGVGGLRHLAGRVRQVHHPRVPSEA